jgi:hypothetical protein
MAPLRRGSVFCADPAAAPFLRTAIPHSVSEKCFAALSASDR